MSCGRERKRRQLRVSNLSPPQLDLLSEALAKKPRISVIWRLAWSRKGGSAIRPAGCFSGLIFVLEAAAERDCCDTFAMVTQNFRNVPNAG